MLQVEREDSGDQALVAAMAAKREGASGAASTAVPGAKKIFLIRHGHSTFNAWRSKTLRTCTCCIARWTAQDAPLSERGRAQVQALHREVAKRGLREEVQLLVTSPLTRALDTAIGGFFFRNGAGAGESSGEGAPDALPLIALPLVAERLDTACDIGRPRSVLQGEYPRVDFSLVEEHWWYGGADNFPAEGQRHDREPTECCKQRVAELMRWLVARPESCIAVVGHSAFFKAMTGSATKMDNCAIVEIELTREPRVRVC